jgi:hypothetical protein
MRDANFSKSMREDWNASFESLLCVPVYGSSDTDLWVPLGVVYFTSSRGKPFWMRLSARETEELETLARNLFDAVYS